MVGVKVKLHRTIADRQTGYFINPFGGSAREIDTILRASAAMMSPLVETSEPALTFDPQGAPGVSGLLSRHRFDREAPSATTGARRGSTTTKFLFCKQP